MNRDFFKSTREVVVSGIGIVSPLGSTRELTWTNLLAGKTGIFPSEEGLIARVNDFSPNGARSRMGDFAILAAAEALQHAGLCRHSGESRNPGLQPSFKQQVEKLDTGFRRYDEFRGNDDVGCAISQSKPLLSEMRNPTFSLDPSLLLSSFTGWSAEAVVRREFGLGGPAGNLVAACATGIASIDQGAFWIKTGVCDIVLVGAAESSLHPLYRSGFEQMGVLSTGENSDSVCPFDRDRNGFAMGEGAAVLVLESLESVQRRGHSPIASLKGVSLHQSAIDSLKLEKDGASVCRLIKTLCPDGEKPDYINAHGTGTVFNDLVETRGIRKAFGRKATMPVSSTKAATGHLLGAAGALEAAFAVLSLRDQKVPPTLHLDHPDPECDLDYVPNQSRSCAMTSALSLSYGFGGQMGAVVFKKNEA